MKILNRTITASEADKYFKDVRAHQASNLLARIVWSSVYLGIIWFFRNVFWVEIVMSIYFTAIFAIAVFGNYKYPKFVPTNRAVAEKLLSPSNPAIDWPFGSYTRITTTVGFVLVLAIIILSGIVGWNYLSMVTMLNFIAFGYLIRACGEKTNEILDYINTWSPYSER